MGAVGGGRRSTSVTGAASTGEFDLGYFGGILPVTLLAPDIVESIMDGRQAAEVTLPVLMGVFLVE